MKKSKIISKVPYLKSAEPVRNLVPNALPPTHTINKFLKISNL